MDPTEFKTLFQWKSAEENGFDALRLVVLLQESTLRELLKQMEDSGKHCAHISTELPINNCTVAVEVYQPDKVQKSDLHYFKCIQEPGYQIDHVNLI